MQPAKIKEGYAHLFSMPIDALFALIPYSFWDLMAFKSNRYATQYLQKQNTKKVSRNHLQAMTVSDLLTYFAILFHAMLYPQTGRRLRDSWADPIRNPCTSYMGKGRFIQGTSMLHFNNNEDRGGMKSEQHSLL
jgi:hypothetical protein